MSKDSRGRERGSRQREQTQDRTALLATELSGECRMLQAAQRILARRRLRPFEFGDAMFGEPGWEMLLELYVRDGSGLATATPDLLATTRTPRSTASRWVKVLQQKGLICARSSEAHPDWEFLDLCTKGRAALERYFDAIDEL